MQTTAAICIGLHPNPRSRAHESSTLHTTHVANMALLVKGIPAAHDVALRQFFIICGPPMLCSSRRTKKPRQLRCAACPAKPFLVHCLLSVSSPPIDAPGADVEFVYVCAHEQREKFLSSTPARHVKVVLCRVVSSGMITDKRWLFDHFVADYSRFLEHHVVHIRKVGAASRAFQVAGRIVAAARERGGMAFACAAALQKHKTNTLDGGGGCGE
ncbi:unnamed protein product [Heligmosomoides polygyrus]|uniref:Uncharacterized protein n=1 Tax=Heligmosomoides polygyrus TaxID=6339 RepID=A0A3P8FBN4_HELPZ|nr:unnamed protein product [Heligmosomoides polygyrus]